MTKAEALKYWEEQEAQKEEKRKSIFELMYDKFDFKGETIENAENFEKKLSQMDVPMLTYLESLLKTFKPTAGNKQKSHNRRREIFKHMEALLLGIHYGEKEEPKKKTKAQRMAEDGGQKYDMLLSEYLDGLLDCICGIDSKISVEEARDKVVNFAKNTEKFEKELIKAAKAKEPPEEEHTLPTIMDGLKTLEPPKGVAENIYRNIIEDDEWMTFKYGDKVGVAHIEAGGRYFDENGDAFTKVSLFFNVDGEKPIGLKDKDYNIDQAYPLNDSNIRMVGNRGYKVELSLPEIKSVSGIGNFRYTDELMTALAANPDIAKIRSISEYGEQKLVDKENNLEYRFKACRRDITNKDGALDKELSVEKLLNTGSKNSPENLLAETMKKFIDAEDKTHVKAYAQKARAENMQENFYSEHFKEAVADTLESTIKQQCLWQEAREGRGQASREDKRTETISIYLTEDNIIEISPLLKGEDKATFTITKIAKDNDRLGGLKGMTLDGPVEDVDKILIKGEWDISKLGKPQYDFIAATSFVKALKEHPETVKFLEYEAHDKEDKIVGTKEAPDFEKIREEKELEIKENTDSFNINGYEALEAWGKALNGALDGKDKTAEVLGRRMIDSLPNDALFTYPITSDAEIKVHSQKNNDIVEIEFSRALSEAEIKEHFPNEVSDDKTSGYVKDGRITMNAKLNLYGSKLPDTYEGLLRLIASETGKNNVEPVETKLKGTVNDKLYQSAKHTHATEEPPKKEIIQEQTEQKKEESALKTEEAEPKKEEAKPKKEGILSVFKNRKRNDGRGR